MRIFALFLALLMAALIGAAALTYPAWLLVELVSEQPVHRVMHRVAMLLALIGLIVLTRRLDLWNRAAMGYGVPRAQFLRQFVWGAVSGIALMVPLVALLLGWEIRIPREELSTRWGLLVLQGALAGIVIAAIEETFFRGVLFSGLRRSAGMAAAVILPSLLYAALHFLTGKLRIPKEEVDWEHGFVVLGKLFELYAHPALLIDSFLALFVLGVLLALVRARTGAIAASMGLHAAGVCVIAVLREQTIVDRSSTYGWLVGTYDGVIGWLALIWFLLIAGSFAVSSRAQLRAPK